MIHYRVMKFNVKDNDKSKKKSAKKSKPNTPFKVKVVDVNDESKTKSYEENKSSKVKSKSSEVPEEKFKPNLDLLITDKDELEEFDEQSENDLSGDDEGGEGDGDYENFMEEMAKIDGKKKMIVSNRGEGVGVSEYSMTNTNKNVAIDSTDLLPALEDDANEDVRRLQIRLKRTGDDLKLDTALDDVTKAKVIREAGYSGVKKDISVWDAVVHSRRSADTLSFPLNKVDLRIKNLSEDTSKFKAETSLEQQVAAMLAGAESVAGEGETLSKIEKKCLEGLTVQEALERKQQLAKIKALQTYQEQKFRRMKKIKSKKFRKIERKMKKKEEMAEIEQLSKYDPEAAAEKLEQLEKSRIEERASLKHRNASKYLHDVAKRAKLTKNKEFTNVIQEQLRKHRSLTAKQQETVDSDDDNDDVEEAGDHVNKAAVNNINEMSVEEFNSDYRKYWKDQQDKKAAEKSEEVLDELFDEADHQIQLNLKQKISSFNNPKTGKPADEEPIHQDEENPSETLPTDSLNYDKKLEQKRVEKLVNDKPELPNVNPDDIINMKTDKIGSDLPDIVGYNDLEDDEEDNDQKNMIAEAFADDDVVDEFKNEKKKLTDSLKPKDIDLTLPGWGEWGGGGAKPSKRKRSRFIIKAPPAEKRRDEKSGHLILNTDKDTQLRKHLVSDIPFQFQAVSDFEASIRAPVGSTFIPRTAHLKMIKPKVTTKAGHIIEPMDRDQLVKRGVADIAMKT